MKYFLFVMLILAAVFDRINCWPDFFLYNSATNRVQVQAKDLADALNKHSGLFNEVFFVIHGFLGHSEKDWMIDMKDALLETSAKRSVIVVDWKDGASSFLDYKLAASNAIENGARISEFIKQSGLDPKRVTCVGHSLGAHSCGFAGKSVKLGRISGLDPASPSFSGKGASQRLDKSDADFVDIIHTDVCVFGITEAIGHVDFYPNGGRGQPGCHDTLSYVSKCLFSSPVAKRGIFSSVVNSITGWSSDLIKKITKCSHSKSQKYYIDSIRTPFDTKLQSTKSDSYESYKKLSASTKCKDGCILMGHGAINANFEGSFFNDYGQ